MEYFGCMKALTRSAGLLVLDLLVPWPSIEADSDIWTLRIARSTATAARFASAQLSQKRCMSLPFPFDTVVYALDYESRTEDKQQQYLATTSDSAQVSQSGKPIPEFVIIFRDLQSKDRYQPRRYIV